MELAALIGRLNADSRRALERAAQRCLQRTHHYVEIEHLLLELLDIEGGDLAWLLPRFGLERDSVATEINRALELFKAGSTRTPALSAQTIGLLEDALVQASVQGQASIRSGLLLLALLDRDERRSLLLNSASSLLRIPREALRANLLEWTQASREYSGGTSPTGKTRPTQETSQDSVLDQYTQDLTADAHAGRIDPIVGRDSEIRQSIDILLRRRQNNPILVGAPGVGKTAVVEGLALRIAAGDVPPPLQNVILRVLDLGLLQAGAGVKGEFEQRLKGVIDAVRSSEQPIILFIDEAHTLIGAGGSEGGSDAANRPWPVANCAPWQPRPGWNTRSTSRRIPPWPAVSSWYRWRNPMRPPLWKCYAVSPPSWSSTMACRCSTAPSRTQSSSPTATYPAASCRTRPSACSTPPAPASPSASTTYRHRWKACATAKWP
jgi:type VI secretion system protein VasG